MRYSVKQLLWIGLLSVATVSGFSQLDSAQAASRERPHPDGGALVMRAYGPAKDPETGGPVQGNVLVGSYKTPLFDETGERVGHVTATETTLSFQASGEGRLTIDALSAEPSWITLSESIPLTVIPMSEVFESNVPAEYQNNDDYELVVFTGRLENIPRSAGTGMFRQVSTLEFRCAFICKKSLFGPGLGEPVFSLNRLYVLS